MRDRFAVVVSCEHGTNRVPRGYEPLFRGCRALLESHRGHDPGSLALGRELARRFDAPLIAAPVTRLLVETNRSEGHPRLFSEQTRGLPAEERARILERWWRPHRAAVEAAVTERIRRRRCVVHLGAHTFTPVLDGDVRRADVAFLYDPQRPLERALCLRWQAELRGRAPELVVRRNYPYRGVSDGLTTTLRERFPADAYLGIELEVNQRWPAGEAAPWRRVRQLVVESLVAALRGLPQSR